ncbi:ABC1-domain-containing protein [Nadsonia fulvescens var. elongata DSM 6958]|uniref:ABC1-domain-containing protein n=1 Tax=Nadsonia fulvescens var. elongata DSM 6958 TaxID=857566 RepID=A0A1E3PTD9_9ASCO|nr:ABC1-domain-containing protein [Nadsonia fulvescens var. elongata DSM 6958]
MIYRESVPRIFQQLKPLGLRYRSTAHFDSLKAIDPASLSTRPRAPIKSKWPKRALYITGLVGLGLLGYSYDRYYKGRAFARASRAVYVLLRVAADYKLNYGPHRDIARLHERNADLIYDLLIGNKGLYIKIGQSIAMQASLLPKPYQEKFGQLFDGAPADSYALVEELFKKEFKGRSPEDLFAQFDHHPVASASIAQVHKAQLKDSGQWVAVKVQHPDIAAQMELDLSVYKALMYVYENYLFHMPMYFIADYVAGRLRLETDFRNEIANGERLRACLKQNSTLSDRVHIPLNFPELSTSRVMVSEWIEGVSLSNTAELQNPKHGINLTQSLQTIIELFSNQIFQWGVVHCDPHPGNMIIRPHPTRRGKHQVVLIDHGLYVYENDIFRRQYSELWESMFNLDIKGVERVVSKWGFGEPEMFASMTLLKPYKTTSKNQHPAPKAHMKEESEFEKAQTLKERLKKFLQDTTVIPLELLFLARTIRILQGLNQRFGSRVNRVKIMAKTAAKSLLVTDQASYMTQTKLIWRYLRFRCVVLLSDVGFYTVRLYQKWLGSSNDAGAGMEDILGRHIMEISAEYGLDVDSSKLFEG